MPLPGDSTNHADDVVCVCLRLARVHPAADAIDLTDDRWEVFYLFEEETPRQVLGEKWKPNALAGYFTVFGFRNPVKGVSLRICQALILPLFQRQGKAHTGEETDLNRAAGIVHNSSCCRCSTGVSVSHGLREAPRE